LTTRIQQLAINAFRAIDGYGIARIDFLAKPDENVVYLNEINTMPGSLASYLWQESGMSMTELGHIRVQLERDAHADKRGSTYDYPTDLINLARLLALKGLKGAKAASRCSASS